MGQGADGPVTTILLEKDYVVDLVLETTKSVMLKRLTMGLKQNDDNVPIYQISGYYHAENLTIERNRPFKALVPLRLPFNVCPTINTKLTKINYHYLLEVVTQGLIGTTAHYNLPIKIGSGLVLADKNTGYLPFINWRRSLDITDQGNYR